MRLFWRVFFNLKKQVFWYTVTSYSNTASFSFPHRPTQRFIVKPAWPTHLQILENSIFWRRYAMIK